MAGPRIVLVRTKLPDNIGAAARAMKNFGLHDLVLVAPRRAVNRQAYALASHAGDILDNAKIVHTTAEAVADMHTVLGVSARLREARNYPVYTPREAAPVLTNGTALLFGPEDHGLANDDLTLCQGQVRIPTGEYPSLNLAQAVLLVVYDWFQHHGTRPAAPPKAHDERKDTKATRAQLEGLYAHLEESLKLIEYTDEQRAFSIMRAYRALFDRAQLTEYEVAALRGLAAKIRWTAQQPPERFFPEEP